MTGKKVLYRVFRELPFGARQYPRSDIAPPQSCRLKGAVSCVV